MPRYTTLETITGNLRDAYRQCVPGTIQHVDELMNERRTNSELCSKWFYTADGIVYSVDNGIPTLRITREEKNPILNNIDNVFPQTIQEYKYSVSENEFNSIKESFDTVTIDVTKLTLHIGVDGRRFLPIPTRPIPTIKHSVTIQGYNRLNSEDRKLAERIYGQGNDFVENMQMLHDADIKCTLIYVLDPMEIKSFAKENAIGSVLWLNNFFNDSNFSTNIHSINTSYRLRGERKISTLSPSPTPRDRQSARDLNAALNPTPKQSPPPNPQPITTPTPSLSIEERITSLYQTLPHFSDVDAERIRASPHDIEIYERLAKKGCTLDID